MLKCAICGKELSILNSNHLRTHGITLEEYREKFGGDSLPKKSRRSSLASTTKKRVQTSEELTSYYYRLVDQLIELEASITNMPPWANIITRENPEELDHVVAMAKQTGLIEVDLETTGLRPYVDKIVGVVITVSNQPDYNRNYYIPLEHTDKYCNRLIEQLDKTYVFERLRPIMEDPGIKKSFHHALFDLLMSELEGLSIKGFAYDTLVAAHILNENEPSYKLKDLVKKYQDLGYIELPEDAVMERYEKAFGDPEDPKKPRLPFNYVPLKVATRYACKDGLGTRKLREFQMEHLSKLPKLMKVLEEVEYPLIPILVEMRKTGIRADEEYANQLAEEFRKEIPELLNKIYSVLGEINLNSPKQLSKALFEDLGLPDPNKGKKNAGSTRKEVLQQLAEDYPVCRDILDYKGKIKILSTYLESIGKYINPVTGKVHCYFNSTGARTGRFSSSDPNLQNLPKRTDPRPRRIFRAGEGRVLISADYSQIEPRLTAHICQEPKLIEAFINGVDMYTRMAAEVLKKPVEECGEGSPYRQIAKTLWLAITYDMSAYGLAARLKISEEEAEEILRSFFTEFRGVDEKIKFYKDFCRRHGYVETIIGRKRRIPEIWHEFLSFRKKAERQTFNSVIQGSAADVMKLAMINLGTNGYLKKDLNSALLVTVHDEVIVEAPLEVAGYAADLVEKDMIRVGKDLGIVVPFKVDAKIFMDGRWASEEVMSKDKWFEIFT